MVALGRIFPRCHIKDFSHVQVVLEGLCLDYIDLDVMHSRIVTSSPEREALVLGPE